MIDVLNCVNDMDNDIFSLSDIYRYFAILQKKHMYNHNIEAKIRQQLQILRDKKFIEFTARGEYKKLI